ncbi:hypoxia up-regulated protein 1 [Diabrotica virgifera virgifera]|uniref:Hypoxia up-regulated protein 1 n=1 Tax=Diabrotica virgifera virgifera TaxID=50390 RepID=A0ABM5IAH8_DIAVI|nr:hypoxia up-regulated protein 1 [Diabrotica virgifera virgifera]
MQLSVIVTLLLVCYTGVTFVNSLAVMSVDLGSEWMKVGIVSPGVPMEIALNKESKRKTPAVISFRDNTRLFGEDAQTMGVRFPKQTFSYLLDLLGKSIDHPLVKLYQERFPYYNIIEDPERKTVLFKIDEETAYSPEELVAQFLGKAKEFAETNAQQPIKECVLTVPGYFNQIERKALLQAAELAGLKVLQLINDYTAVALNYGIFRSKTFNDTAQYIMFYDMGASSTTATLVSYQSVKTKDKPYVEVHPQATILGVGFDRTLGGLEMQVRLRNYLAKKFNEMKKTNNDVFKNDRAMAKLFKEAGRVKNVLSANAEHAAQIEGLLDEKDFKLPVTRDEMEALFGDLFERVNNPIEQALKTAHLTMDVVNQVVLVGAGTRVPKVQEHLRKAVGQELAKNLNTDEAAAMGAVYKAADLSTGFKVAKFITKDAVVYPIQVTFERLAETGVKQVKRTLFGLMNSYPQKKIITFNKHTSDFNFNVNYADLDFLNPKEIQYLGTTNISQFELKGVADALKKHSGENVESKGIKAHFAMDDSGILNFVNVELVVEKTVVPDEEEGTLSKLGSTFSKLFGGDEKPAEEKPTDAPPSEDKQAEEAEEKPVEEKEEPKEKVSKDSKKTVNETAKNATEKVKDTKPKVQTVKESITTVEQSFGVPSLNKKQLGRSQEKIDALDKIEMEINRKATAMNNLESFVIDMQNKLYEDEYTEATTVEEQEKIKTACSEISEWLYDEGSDADAETYEKKIDSLMAITKDVLARVYEHKERPEALNALNTRLNQSSNFLVSAKNATKDNPERDIFTDVEVQTLEKIIKETEEWRDKMVKEQDATKKSDPVKLTIKSIVDKMAALDREVKYLLNKAKMWKPKKVDKPVKEDTNTTDSGSENVVVEEPPTEEPVAEESKESPKKEQSKTKKDKPSETIEGEEDSHSEL